MANNRLIKLICKLPPKWKRRLMLKIEGDDVWMHGGKPLGPAMSAAINTFVPEDLQKDNKYMKQLSADIKQCYRRYDLLPAEYFYFDFADKNWEERDEYLTDAGEDEILVKKIGYDKYLKDLSDKYHFYEQAKPFFHRGIMLFDEHTGLEFFREFCLKARHLFIKPLAGSEGDGSFVFEALNIKAVYTLFEKLVATKKKWMVEERIKQSDEFAHWNASSVNTVRLPTFLGKGVFFVLAPIFRTGRAGKPIDNTSAGGVFALVDSHNGMICSHGYDITTRVYEKHPDSGVVFMNYQIPQWETLLQTAEQVHRTFPEHPYIAWDFAHTNQGWELIEGNWGRFRGAQLAGKKGLKSQFMEYINGTTTT